MSKNTDNSRKRSTDGSQPWKNLGGVPDGVSKKDMSNKGGSPKESTKDAGNIHRGKNTNGGRQWKNLGGAPDGMKKSDPRDDQKSKDYNPNG